MSDAMKRIKDMAITLQSAKTTQGVEKEELMNKFWNLAADGINDLELGKPFVPETANDVVDWTRSIEL